MASYDIGRLVWKIDGDTTGIDRSLKKSESGFSKIMSTAKGFLGIGLAAGLTLIGKAALKGASDLEQQNVAFTVLLGSAGKAKALIADLRNLAAFTPFSQSDLIDNAKLLLNFGVNAKDVTDTLSRLGDVASGNSEKLHSLTLAFAQVSSAGKLNGQDLLQMINAGFNPLQEIAAKTGKSMAVLRKEMEAGRIGIDQVKGAFVAATSEGGRFYQMNQKQSQTLAGQWSTLKDNVEVFLTALGGVGAEPLKDFVNSLNRILTLVNKLNGDFGIFGNIVSGALKPISLLVDYSMLVVNGMASAAEALGIGATETEKLKKEVQALEVEEAKYLRMKIPADSADIKNIREKIALKKELLKTTKTNDAYDDREAWRLKQLEKEEKAPKPPDKELTADQKKWYDEKKALAKSTSEAVADFENSESEKIKAEFVERQASYKKYKLNTEKDIAALSDYAIITNEKIKAAEQKEFAERIGNYNTYAQQVGGAITGLLSAFQNLFDARAKADIDALDAQMEAELEAAGVSEETTLEQAQREYDVAVASGDANITEEKRRALEKAKIEEKYQNKKKQLEYEAALQSWEFQRAIAALQIPLSIMNAVASAAQAPWFMQPWFMNAMGAMAGVTAGAQYAAVEASKPQPPKFASGGIIPGSAQGTQITAGENNQTEVVMNPNQMANTLMAIGNGGGGGVRQLPAMSADSLWKTIFQASQNGDLYIAERAVVNK
jgi:tape measure domain-containing protein